MTMQRDRAFDFAAARSVFTAQRAASDLARPGPRDRCTTRNERIKLGSSFLNAIGLTLIAFALLRPFTQNLSALTALSTVVPPYPGTRGRSCQQNGPEPETIARAEP